DEVEAGEQPEGDGALVELGRVDPYGQAGELDAERAIGRSAIAAALEKAAELADGQAEHDGRGSGIGHRPEIEAAPASKPGGTRDREDEAAIEREPALPEPERGQTVPVGLADASRIGAQVDEVLELTVGQDGEDPGPDDPEDQEIGRASWRERAESRGRCG